MVEPGTERDAAAACRDGNFERATTIALRGYGGEVLTFLGALARDEHRAQEAFAVFCEDLWRGLSGFKWSSTLRTWCYSLARHALHRVIRGDQRSRLVIETVDEVAAEVRTATASFLRTEVQNALGELRARLDPDDQAILVLRVNRELPWRDIARVMTEGELAPGELAQKSAALRKRFERIKQTIREELG